MEDPLAPYDFALPDEQIARFPPPERHGGRLLYLGPGLGEDHPVLALPELLRPGDLLVYNDVFVQKARLSARRQPTEPGRVGGHVEVMLASPLEEGWWAALLRPARRLRSGEVLRCGRGTVELGARLDETLWRVRPAPDAATLCEEAGTLPLPPYLGRDAGPEDEERYQTVYARRGALAAAAAPTAGLHFSRALLERLALRGVARAGLTLAVGAGTFLPLRAKQLEEGKLHSETFWIPPETWAAVADARRGGGRIVAVGTTTLRALESAAGPGLGRTELFIRGPHRFRHVDLLFTNFHLPRSSLLMLVSAFGGHDRVMAAYRRAIDEGYRFFSYGDAMLLTPEAEVSDSTDRAATPQTC